MKLSVTLDRDEDGVWVAECPAIPGCVSQGKTKPKARKNIEKAIESCLEVRAERGWPLTIETCQVEVLEELLHGRRIESWRAETATGAVAASRSFRSGKLKSTSADQVIARLREAK